MDVASRTVWGRTHTRVDYRLVTHAHGPFYKSHTHAWRLEQETLTDFLLSLRKREAAQLTHGTTFPLLLFPFPCFIPVLLPPPVLGTADGSRSPASFRPPFTLYLWISLSLSVFSPRM